MGNFKKNLVQLVLGNTTRLLGEKVEYRYKNGGSIKINAIFDNQWEQLDPDTERVVSTNQPVLGLRLSDLSQAPSTGDEVLIIEENIEYVVQDTREDGQGGASYF